VLGISLIALLTYVYYTLLGRFLIKEYVYGVKRVNVPATGMVEVVMEPKGKRFEYFPGQFIFVSFGTKELRGEKHPFTISSAPHESDLRITVKALGDYTQKMQGLSVGTRAFLEGPFGSFSYLRGNNKKQIWIAGGIGITPFLNMSRDIVKRRPEGYEIDLYYSVALENEIVFVDELSALHEKYSGMRFIPFVTKDRGYLTADGIEKESEGIFGKDMYVCGPPKMMGSLIEQFKKKGVPNRNIHAEEFKLLQ
jgi:predicted ferric reductase